MMSPPQIKEILHSSSLSENEITQQIIVRCLDKISVKQSYKFRGLRFTGGRDERGTDIEYYEMIGPDNFRHYTGIQVKKKNLGVAAAKELIIQGSRALDKRIIDPEVGSSYPIHRWIVATTGTISPDAEREIREELRSRGRPISFWNGIKLGELIFDNFYSEFVDILQVPPKIAGQSSSVTQWWNPDDPPVLKSDFAATEWSSIDISDWAPPGLVSGIYISARPVGDVLPPVKFAVRSSIDEVLVDSYLSRVRAYLLRLDGDTTIEATLVEGDRPITILADGCQYFR